MVFECTRGIGTNFLNKQPFQVVISCFPYEWTGKYIAPWFNRTYKSGSLILNKMSIEVF
jgi:hypothetical protein